MKITFSMPWESGRNRASAAGGTALSLLAANALTLVLALVEGWDLASVLGVYWAQSVIIGIFQVFKILDLRNFTTDGMTQNGRPVPATRASQVQAALFFAFHYGFFHFVYLAFLLSQFHLAAHAPRYFPFAVGAFFANHLYSYLGNREEDRERKQNLGSVFFFPYARIVPMHLIIVSGAFLAGNAVALAVFLALKTVADLVMHRAEHRLGSAADRRVSIPG